MNANHGIEGRCNYSSKCDRCEETFDLLRHGKGYRCTQCIWNERVDVIKEARALLDSLGSSNLDQESQQVKVHKSKLDALHKAVLFAQRKTEN